ncbi:YdeI/OmpD-associated family protein [Chryseobacterium geocarposphaerae]|uniref:Bacteriocin resistance YdeI/OmpD-like protein n=1 Tax=Chryseobacterium geocarposphaerae TaxID=1416776 RepID=A0A2M9C1Y0_9FLAO|nr:YdeI/OmpD-associated family protein [Chryseobacterium geocarposphaerae]PJJ64441.1 bacteriocin resistance YdeI/OmpD-like protein [Chryseobacterium geocarposphaerae]
MKNQSVQFNAIIQQNGEMNAAFVEFPFSTIELFDKKGQVKIKALFDDKVEYRGSLVKMKSDCHILGLTQEIRKQLNKTFGDNVSVSLIEDKEERTVEIADDISSIFNENEEAKILFDKMSYTHRKEYIRWIEEAKKPETRENRKIKMIQMILNGKKGI